MDLATSASIPVSGNADLAIIIVNWNSSAYLEACLESIVDAAGDLNYEVHVVDNNSSGDTLDHTVCRFPFIDLVKNNQNVGFARANNIGADRTTAPYLLFLNPDTVVLGTALSSMLNELRDNRETGIVGCRLLNTDRTLQTSCIQRFPRIWYQILSSQVLETLFPRLPLWGLGALYEENTKPKPVEVVSGACLMTRRDLYTQLGGFCEEYFMYAEDVDLCYRARQTGRQCKYVGSVAVIHHGGGSSRLRCSHYSTAVLQWAAKLQFVRRTRTRTYAALFRLAMAANAAVRCCLSCAAGMVGTRNQRNRFRFAMQKWTAIFEWAIHPDPRRQSPARPN